MKALAERVNRDLVEREEPSGGSLHEQVGERVEAHLREARLLLVEYLDAVRSASLAGVVVVGHQRHTAPTLTPPHDT